MLFATTNSAAQIKYQEGYVVTMNQDTVHGVIKEKLNHHGFDILLKKSASAKEAVLYTPDDIQQVFFIEGQERYRSKSREVKNKNIQVFFKHLIAGPIDFYTYVDEREKEHFFVETEELGLRELLVSTTTIIDEETGKAYFKTIKRFLGILKLALKDCPNIYSNIEEVKFFEKSFINCILAYYNCTGEAHWTRTINFEKRKKIVLEYGVFGGVNYLPFTSKINPDSHIALPGSAYGILNRVYLPKAPYRYSIDFGVSVFQRPLRNTLTSELSSTTQVVFPVRVSQYFFSGNFRFSGSTGIELAPSRDHSTVSFRLGFGCDLKLNKRFRIALLSNFRVTKFRQADVGLVLFFS